MNNANRPYTGPTICKDFTEFINSSFTVLTTRSNEPFRLPLSPLLITLNDLKKSISEDFIKFKNESIIIPQISDQCVIKESEYNPFSKNYKRIAIFSNVLLVIYLPLFFSSILVRISSNNVATINYEWTAYRGFVLRDVIPQPNFSTSIYFYRLTCLSEGEPIFSYKENRYNLIDIESNTTYEFKSGIKLITDIPDETKVFYYSAVL